jgi:hypothetical protein
MTGCLSGWPVFLYVENAHQEAPELTDGTIDEKAARGMGKR